MSAQTYQTLKGFRDFIGPDAQKRAWLTQVFRDVFEAQGFEPLETPALEYEDLLLGKYGEEANKLIYGFEDRGGRRVALRYDQTIPVARVASQYRNELVFPYKRYQIQPVWRADKPQKGRYREFIQCDIDIIDAREPVADAQILNTVSSVFAKLDVPISIKVNDRAQLIELIKSAGISDDQIFSIIQTIDKLDKKSDSEVIAELREKGLTESVCNSLFTSFSASKPSEKLVNIMRLATTLGTPESQIVYTPTLARGLDYYTGGIFEVVIPEYKGGSVAGGGRYDNLIGSLVDFSVPAVGLAFGFDRLIDALDELGKIPTDVVAPAQVLMTIFSPDSTEYATSLVRLLQKSGVKVEFYADQNKKLETQIKYAIAKKIPYVIIAGPEEQQNRVAKVKNLETREQQTLSPGELIGFFAKQHESE